MKDWFAHCKDLKEAQAEYRRLCFKYHPDHGGDTTMMQAINVAYTEFKLELTASRPAATSARSRWQRPQRQRPADTPPSRPAPEPEPMPIHSRDYFKSIWRREPWQPMPNGGVARVLWGHTVLLFQHPERKYRGAWFVVLDDVFSPYMYASRDEAEQSAFELVYQKVKYLDV
ncbi:MAG TPA: hypothetical protein VFZ66_28600 [Herpetosiphonaceae bacterium]